MSVSDYVLSQSNASLSATSSSWTAKPFERKAFIENKGQYATDLPSGKNKFSYCIDNGSKIFFYNNEVLFYFSRPLSKKEDWEEEEEKLNPEEEREREAKLSEKEKQFISMKWLNANPNATIEVSEEQTVDYGYIITHNTPKNYTAHCKGFSKLKIKNLYNGIDAEYFFTEKDGFKYNLYISPGADIKQVQQHYEGTKNIELVNGNLLIETIQGNIIDHAPVSYLSTNQEQKLKSNFVLHNNTVSFDIENPSGGPITIDPWVTVPTMPTSPVDNGVDVYGNSYMTSPQYILEKYSPTGALIFSIDIMGGAAPYYGDMLTDSRGYCFFNTVCCNPRGDATAVDSAGNFLWDSFGITECWRFVLNECNQQVLSLTGNRHSATGFAKIDTETGALAGYTQSGTCCQDPHCGVIDYNGDVFCIASDFQAGGTIIYKWTPANTIAATYPAIGNWGYGYQVSVNYYTEVSGLGQGLNGMAILGNNLYIYDGATLFKVNKANGTIITQVTVPGGVNKRNGGIYVTSCGKIFVGSSTGVYMYDINFNQVDFKATTGPVYDLAFNSFNQTISTCGPGHVTELAFVIPPCVFQTQPVIQPSCAGLPNGFIKLNLTGGVPDYTYTWTINGTTLPQTTDSIGNLLPGTYKCVYYDNKCPIPNKDSIELVVPSVIANAAFAVTDVCEPVANLLTDSSYLNLGTITSWSWKYGDGNTSVQQNNSHTYASIGTYTVSLLIATSDGCIDSVSKNVTVFPKPLANFTSLNKCDGKAVPFNSTSTISNPGVLSNWNWNFGDNNTGTGSSTSHLYNAPGNYTVTLIVNSADLCSDTATSQITVFNDVTADFTLSDICFGGSIPFNNNSSVSLPASISGYVWNFGDGSPVSNLQTPAYNYATNGTYNVKLIATTADGCKDSISKSVTVFAKPEADFTSTNKCNGTAVPFNSTSAINNPGTITGWSWNFGDNTTGTGSSTSHLYSSPGNYNVTLLVTSSNLCTDTITNQITVFNNPVASFFHADVCFGDSIYFTNSSSIISPASIAFYLWDFGDGGPTSNLQNPAHKYGAPGTYNVTLITASADACSDAQTSFVNTFDAPAAAFTHSNICLLDSAAFINTSLSPTMGAIADWSWNFGDGSPLNTAQQSPQHLYSSPGNYQVTLISHSTNLGCADTATAFIDVYPMPAANFGFMDVCLNELMNFYDSSLVASGSNTSWVWDYGDATAPASIQNPVHTYAAHGIYSVSLIVTTNNGCQDTIAKNVTVHPLPDAAYSSSNVCLGTISDFTDLSTIPANPANDVIQTWIWNFGDGSPVTSSQNTSHLYANSGSFQVELLVVSSFGCKDSSTATSIIHPNPVVDFEADSTVGCEVLCVNFQDLSSIASPGNNTSWLWNLGNTTASTQSTNYCYNNDSVYTPVTFSISLQVTSDSGCITSVTKNNYITVYPRPDAAFSALPGTVSITDPVIAITNLSSGGNFWHWNFGDQDTTSVPYPVSHTYADTGTYLITQIVSTLFNCEDTAYQTVVLQPLFTFFIPNAFTPNDDGINDFFTGNGMFITEFEMTIFDRWGNLIFFSDDFEKPWDGTANYGTEAAQSDVYVYKIKILDINNNNHSYRGIVTLVR